jgi:hypothetical protein
MMWSCATNGQNIAVNGKEISLLRIEGDGVNEEDNIILLSILFGLGKWTLCNLSLSWPKITNAN